MNNHEYLVKRIDQLDERTRRIETRLCKLMIAMGVDPAGGDETPTPPRDYPQPPTPAQAPRSSRLQIPALFKPRTWEQHDD